MCKSSSLYRHVLLPLILTSYLVKGDSCLSFMTNTTYSTGEDGCSVTLTFAINNTCDEVQGFTGVVDMFNVIKFPEPVCAIKLNNSECAFASGCVCDDTQLFSFTRKVDKRETWRLVGTAHSGQRFKTTIDISPDQNTQPVLAGALTTKEVINEKSEATTIQASLPPPSGAADSQHRSEPQVVVFILGGAVGVVLLIVTVMSICMGHLLRKRGRLRTLPPPPPAPHNVRRAAGGDVMFNAAQDGRESFVSVYGHDYAEILDDTDTGASNSTLASVSDSSMSDCLHHIACPSSDSSLPEDYLHPVASTGEAATIREERCNSSSSSEAVMYADERITFKKKKRERQACNR